MTKEELIKKFEDAIIQLESACGRRPFYYCSVGSDMLRELESHGLVLHRNGAPEQYIYLRNAFIFINVKDDFTIQ